jgi:UDP:flavonoid glycosyltransferase YjiC (YdhE family)
MLNILFNICAFFQFTAGSTKSLEFYPLKIAISVNIGSRSHAKHLLEISQLLSSRGHHITYLCSEDTLKYSKGYNISNVIVSDIRQDLTSSEKLPFTRKNYSSSKNTLYVYKKVAEIYTKSFPNYEEFYKTQTPDLIICDWLSLSCIDSAAKFSIPMVIGYQSLMFADPVSYITNSKELEPSTIEIYSFWERFSHGVIHPIKKLYVFYEALNEIKKARTKYGVPAALEIVQFKNMGLSIANSYIGFETPRSLPSHFQIIGPVLPDTIPALETDLQFFIDSHRKILYIAFGSLIKFKSEFSVNMLEHFQKLLNDNWIDGILWGGMTNTNLEEFPKSYVVDNIEYSTESILNGSHTQFKLLKWAPQEGILNHQHIILFMTHGGLDSVHESIQSGTPMLVVPHVSDQPRNAILVKEHGIGDYIEWPSDGDILINQKLVNLLDPSNIILKAKMNQFQRISMLSSKRKSFAADLIETYAYSAITCRVHQIPKSFEIPCEIKPFLPLDYQISFIKANLIDVYLVSILIAIATLGLIFFTIYSVIRKYFKVYYKQKKE